MTSLDAALAVRAAPARVAVVDLDALRLTHEPEWQRLAELTRRRRLSGAEADELVRLYQSVATHLSVVRSSAPDPGLVQRLSVLVSRARNALAGAHDPRWSDVVRFATVSAPAAVYRIRWWVHGVTAACVLVAVVAGVAAVNDPAILALLGSPEEQQQYVDEAFAQYYDPGLDFALTVWTNNAWIAAQCIALGITGVWPFYVLANNAVNVGATGGLMAEHGRLDIFFALITPHGLLELTAIFVAGAAGLRLFWTIVDPGRRPRGVALAQEGRATFTIVVTLAVALAVSGIVEGWVTGSTLPWWVKIVIGAIVLAAFWTWVTVLGRRAVRAGETGDLDEDRAGGAQLYA